MSQSRLALPCDDLLGMIGEEVSNIRYTAKNKANFNGVIRDINEIADKVRAFVLEELGAQPGDEQHPQIDNHSFNDLDEFLSAGRYALANHPDADPSRWNLPIRGFGYGGCYCPNGFPNHANPIVERIRIEIAEVFNAEWIDY